MSDIEGRYIKKLAPVLILLAGILWGCIGLFVRPLNEAGLYAMEIVAARSYVTAVAMFLFILIYDRKLLRIHLKDLWCFLGTGICSIIFFNYCYFSCINITSLSVAAVLLYTAPVWVMIISFFLFRDKFTREKVLALFLMIPGCILVTGVTGSAQSVSAKGILVGLGAGLGYALYSIFSKCAIKRGYNTFTIIFYTFLISSVGCLVIADNSEIIDVVRTGDNMLGLSLGFAILCTVVPYITYTIGLKYYDNGKAAIIASIEPVAATLLGAVVFKEQLSVSGVAGVVMVIVALGMCKN